VLTWTRGAIRVRTPTGVAVFPTDLVRPPKSGVERNDNVVHYTRMPHDGRFAAGGQPDLLADDIRALPRSFRTNAPSQYLNASPW